MLFYKLSYYTGGTCECPPLLFLTFFCNQTLALIDKPCLIWLLCNMFFIYHNSVRGKICYPQNLYVIKR